MKVRYFAYIREFTGCGSAEEEYCSTVRELLLKLGRKYGEGMRKTLWEVEGVQTCEEILVMVGGHKICCTTNLDYSLKPEDVVSLFRVVTGG